MSVPSVCRESADEILAMLHATINKKEGLLQNTQNILKMMEERNGQIGGESLRLAPRIAQKRAERDTFLEELNVSRRHVSCMLAMIQVAFPESTSHSS